MTTTSKPTKAELDAPIVAAVEKGLAEHPYLRAHFEKGDTGAVGFLVGVALHALRDAGKDVNYSDIRPFALAALEKKPDDLVFTLYQEHDPEDEYDRWRVGVVKVLRRSSGHGGVSVEKSVATRFRKRLLPGSFYEYREDAIRAFADTVRQDEKKLAGLKRDLEAMRKELAG